MLFRSGIRKEVWSGCRKDNRVVIIDTLSAAGVLRWQKEFPQAKVITVLPLAPDVFLGPSGREELERVMRERMSQRNNMPADRLRSRIDQAYENIIPLTKIGSETVIINDDCARLEENYHAFEKASRSLFLDRMKALSDIRSAGTDLARHSLEIGRAHV